MLILPVVLYHLMAFVCRNKKVYLLTYLLTSPCSGDECSCSGFSK